MVLDWIGDRYSIQKASLHFNIQPKTIRNWVNQAADLRAAKHDGDRLRLKKHSQRDISKKD